MNRTIIRIFCLTLLIISINAFSRKLPFDLSIVKREPVNWAPQMNQRVNPQFNVDNLIQECMRKFEIKRKLQAEILAFLGAFHQRTGLQSPVQVLPQHFIIDALKLLFRQSC